MGKKWILSILCCLGIIGLSLFYKTYWSAGPINKNITATAYNAEDKQIKLLIEK